MLGLDFRKVETQVRFLLQAPFVIMPSQHQGFSHAQHLIAARNNVSLKRAGAILAASTRRASASAKRNNPRLKRVK